MRVDAIHKHVIRIHLKTACDDRKKLLDFCLNDKKKQFLVIGWSNIVKNNNGIEIYDNYCNAIKKYYNKINSERKKNGKKAKRFPDAVTKFKEAEINDLFWTRAQGHYWICRVKGKAIPLYDEKMDIRAALPIEAYDCGKLEDMNVPGQIIGSFSQRQGSTTQKIKGKSIFEYSKYIYNLKSGKEYYSIEKTQDADFLHNLPPFDLEELVISYLQIEKGFYVLSNSIAKNSTTPEIECILMSRKKMGKKAVVQVKADKAKKLSAQKFYKYIEKGFDVYLHCPIKDEPDSKHKEHFKIISKEELFQFVRKNEGCLPESITRWQDIFGKQ